ncbi:MAG TPA: diacylglycerol kinase family protein [Patescibacteria group bacterium]|nr:diacylglycerol kinase family protein [Patescibacteria group bacterium]
MNLKRFWQSLGYAARGIATVFRQEQNFRIQVIMTVMILFLTWFFSLTKAETIVIIILVMLVLILELLNTVVEKFVDLLKPRLTYQVEVIKDMMAAAVFLASIGSLIVGLVIFWPHLVDLARLFL